MALLTVWAGTAVAWSVGLSNRHPSVPMPTGPEFPAEVDWTSIDPRLANRILWLRSAATRAEQELRYVEEELHDPPENEPWFLHRRERCQSSCVRHYGCR